MSRATEKIYTIQKPAKKPDFADLMKFIYEIQTDATATENLARIEADYLSWDEFRKKSWITDDRKEIYWAATKEFRRHFRFSTPIKDKDGNNYTFSPLNHNEFLHDIDLEFGGNFIGIKDFDDSNKRQIIRRNLIEESIASSKLEGANTSREAARIMLKEGRKPRNKSERMIVNNHEAMLKAEQELRHKPLSMETLFELHRIVTKETLEDENLEGKLRETLDAKGNRLKIMPWDETTVAYTVPDREFVDEQLPRLIDFANDELPHNFIHPLFKAVMLHFWVGLLHPFEDGNGRLARILFYWYMLRKGYWAFAYLSLSEKILKSPTQYAMSYLNSEQDDYDLNYFLHYNLKKLKLARSDLQKFAQAQIEENKIQGQIAMGQHGLNIRQIRLLHYLIKDEQRFTNVTAHKNNHQISNMTAVTDLKSLVEKGLLRKLRSGKNINYFPMPKIEEILK